MVTITFAMASLLFTIPNLSKNSIIVPIFKRLKFSFWRNLSAVLSSFVNIPANEISHFKSFKISTFKIELKFLTQ